MSHNTVNCIVFRKTIQEAIRQGKVKFAEDKGKAPMEVDTDPFPKMTGMVNVRSPFECEANCMYPYCCQELRSQDQRRVSYSTRGIINDPRYGGTYRRGFSTPTVRGGYRTGSHMQRSSWPRWIRENNPSVRSTPGIRGGIPRGIGSRIGSESQV